MVIDILVDKVEIGLTITINIRLASGHASASLYPRAPRLGSRAFSICVVNSFRGNFDCCYQLQKQTLLSPSTYGCFAGLAAVCCTLHHSPVLAICDVGYDAWQAEISN